MHTMLSHLGDVAGDLVAGRKEELKRNQLKEVVNKDSEPS